MKTAVVINYKKIDLYKKKLKDKKYIDKAIEGLAGDLISFVNYIEIEAIKIKKRIKWI